MGRLIDEDGLKHSMWEYTDKYGHIEMTITFFNILLERNRVDAIPVVRCKDCRWQITAYCPMPSWERKDNHYCYKGERRGDGDVV